MKLQIKLNHIRFIGLMVFGILFLNHRVYSQKRISSEGNVTIAKHMKIQFGRTKIAILPKSSGATQEVTVALNDGIPEYWNNPRQFFGVGSGKNGATDYFFVIFEPGDFAAYGVQFPMRIKGVRFINNDDQTTWCEVSIYPVQGNRSSWSIDGSALAVRNNVTPQFTGWATVNLIVEPTGAPHVPDIAVNPVSDLFRIDWNGQLATAWSNQAVTFGDANGDGMIDQGDVLPIGFNWGRTHTAASLLTEDETASGKLRGLLLSKLILGINGDTHPDQEFWVEVRVEEVVNLFGIAFDVVYAPTTYVDPQTVEPGTWMGNDVIFYPKIDKNNGRISIVITRKAGQTNVDGSGMIARIKMKMLASASIGDVTNLTLENVAANDSSGKAVTFRVMNQSIVTSIEGRETVEIHVVFELAQNFPNPFNSETHIRYDLPTLTRVRIDIFNMLGRKIRTLVDEEKPAGSFHVVWDGKMDNGQEAASGVYIYFMKTKAYTRHRKLLLMR